MAAPARKPPASAPSLAGEVPLELTIRETSDGGTPITVADPLVFRRKQRPRRICACRWLISAMRPRAAQFERQRRSIPVERARLDGTGALYHR